MTDSTASAVHSIPDRFPPLALDGWFMVHQFVRLNGVPRPGLEARLEGLQQYLSEWHEDRAPGRGWSGLYRVVGGGSDVLLLHLRPTLEGVGDAERVLRRLDLEGDLTRTWDYISVVELGLYAVTDALLEQARSEGVEPGTPAWAERVERVLEAEREKRYVRARLEPVQPPEMPHIYFYPMDKRRKVGQNWYTLPVKARAELMAEHGQTGRRYAGRISQVISGSVGFDDWEWAVTLFARDPLDFKALITEMRYDEVTSVYGEFGPFRVGHRVAADQVVGTFLGATLADERGGS
jgi:hydrogen peroxide-dependent heme synthase